MPVRRYRRKRKPRKVSKSVKKYVKAQFKKELETKYLPHSQTLVLSTSSPNYECISDITQNVSDVARIGDKVTLKGLSMSLFLESASSTTRDTNIRITIFQFKDTHQAGAINPAIAQLYQSTNYMTTSMPHKDYKHRYTILSDKLYSLPKLTKDKIYQKSRRVNLKWATKHIQFEQGTTNGINKIFMVFYHDQALADAPSIAMESYLYYTDA